MCIRDRPYDDQGDRRNNSYKVASLTPTLMSLPFSKFYSIYLCISYDSFNFNSQRYSGNVE